MNKLQIMRRIGRFLLAIQDINPVFMWGYSKAHLDAQTPFKITDLYLNTLAAQKWGQEVVLKATAEGLECYYRKVLLDTPPVKECEQCGDPFFKQTWRDKCERCSRLK